MLSFDENSWKTQFSCSVLQLHICIVGRIPAYVVVFCFVVCFFYHFSRRIIHCQIIRSSLSNIPYISVMQSTMETKSQCVLFGTAVLRSPVVCVILFLISFSGCTYLTRKTICPFSYWMVGEKSIVIRSWNPLFFHNCVADSSILHRSEQYSRWAFTLSSCWFLWLWKVLSKLHHSDSRTLISL